MKIITTLEALQQERKQLAKEQKSVGYVATMGFLHEGHQALMKRSKAENDITVLSIFVNPLQFGEGEDFDTYPRDAERDRLIAEQEGVDIVFMPEAAAMYPGNSTIKLQVTDRVDVLCGKSRPGHFDGVVTVLAKLFHLIQPDRAYFGLKDAQQVAVVQALVHDLNFPLEVVPVPTVREADGLAKSSRNVYLSEQERQAAPAIYRALQQAKQSIEDGEDDADKIVSAVKEFINSETNGRIDYVEILSYPALKPVSRIESRIIIAAAVFFDKARLIDNLVLEADGSVMDRF
ncbi:pantoate--beta-alanine ligase [Terribacillus sp. 7520-G]|uniref:pantoate--beta-alanine ligase n=1 Tax=unclassified Terribacillus TaxID=2636508 RepID=UPI000BA5F770|nr:pantoate--beta-alanine ligase [Terribacillus sp. 7520-G]PAD39330.1 pantoate--beta-alanine ligase [Terribacillus sp. 7520-G]